MTDLDQHILAFYLAKGAGELNMDPRWWPPIELSSIIEDKIRFTVSRFWLAGRPPVESAARAFLDALIAHGAFAAKQGEYGPMYQFQRDPYRAYVAQARAANPILAQDMDDDAWEAAFDRLT